MGEPASFWILGVDYLSDLETPSRPMRFDRRRAPDGTAIDLYVQLPIEPAAAAPGGDQ